MSRKVRHRSKEAHWRRMMLLWIIALFFLMLFVVIDIIYVYNRMHPEDAVLSSVVDYSKIHFEGMALGDKVPEEALQNPVVDASYDYYWKNISITADEDNTITHLAFYTIESGEGNSVTIDDISLDYRDYPLVSISDFATFFGYTKITNFRNYKYLDYKDKGYCIHIELVDSRLYNIELYKEE